MGGSDRASYTTDDKGPGSCRKGASACVGPACWCTLSQCLRTVPLNGDWYIGVLACSAVRRRTSGLRSVANLAKTLSGVLMLTHTACRITALLSPAISVRTAMGRFLCSAAIYTGRCGSVARRVSTAPGVSRLLASSQRIISSASLASVSKRVGGSCLFSTRASRTRTF